MMKNKNIIGSMRHTCQFLTPLEGRDLNGAELKKWITSEAIWCEIQYQLSGSDEENEGARVHAFTRILVTMRHLDWVSEKKRLYFDGKEHDINTVIYDSHRQFMVLDCIQNRPTGLVNWVTEDGENWTDPDGNGWVFKDPTRTISDETNITWADENGNIWTPT